MVIFHTKQGMDDYTPHKQGVDDNYTPHKQGMDDNYIPHKTK